MAYFLVYLMIVMSVLNDLYELNEYINSTLVIKHPTLVFTWSILKIFMFELSGTFLALIRLMEPWVWESFVKELKGIVRWILNTFCCQNIVKKGKTPYSSFAKESLCSFLNSAMNIELVYLILLGINHFMEQEMV